MADHIDGLLRVTFTDGGRLNEIETVEQEFGKYRHLTNQMPSSCAPSEPRDAAGNSVEAVANARRLVACWNACAGISTEALEGGALAKVISEASDCASPDVYSPHPLQALRAALAALHKNTSKPS